MSTLISLAEAQPKLQELIDEVSISREPIIITGKNHNAILISEEIWQGIQETIYLLSIPEVGESIKAGLLTRQFKLEVQQVLMLQRILHEACDSQEIFLVYG
jgi:prevent-host-death family protein